MSDLAKLSPCEEVLEGESELLRPHYLATCSSSSREEELIAFHVFAHALRVVLARVVLLPYAGRKDMLVLLVPSSIDHFGGIWIIVVAFSVLIPLAWLAIRRSW